MLSYDLIWCISSEYNVDYIFQNMCFIALWIYSTLSNIASIGWLSSLVSPPTSCLPFSAIYCVCTYLTQLLVSTYSTVHTVSHWLYVGMSLLPIYRINWPKTAERTQFTKTPLPLCIYYEVLFHIEREKIIIYQRWAFKIPNCACKIFQLRLLLRPFFLLYSYSVLALKFESFIKPP